ncbi:unnamed protein product [Owenia fusiformis]|uniref:Uncharacterized protein n=1 Tax=Owenia fusiformis TaxID=6347 RepID=A0A8J1TER3_OWEFU|nr:unnamed protein product [Owenia fusiformis]
MAFFQDSKMLTERSRLIKGRLFTTVSTHLDCIENMDNYKMREDDVVLSSYPRSGTHWSIAMVNLVMTNGDIDAVKDVHIHDRSIWMEFSKPAIKGKVDALAGEWGPNPMEEAEKEPSPRLFSTHLGYDMLPEDVRKAKCKVIIVLRNPKSVLASFHKLNQSSANDMFYEKKPDAELLLKYQLTDDIANFPFGPWIDAVEKWWVNRESLGNKILFIRFEDMKQDMPKVIKDVAEFLGKDIPDETIGQMAEHLKFSNMSQNPATNDVFKAGRESLNMKDDSLQHMGKGTSDGWKDTFTVAQNERMNEYYGEKLRKIGLDMSLE